MNEWNDRRGSFVVPLYTYNYTEYHLKVLGQVEWLSLALQKE